MWGVDVAVHKTGHHELPVEHRKHGLDGGLWGVDVDMENVAWIRECGEWMWQFTRQVITNCL